jgi:hypothetical protein
MLVNVYATHRSPPEPSFPHVLRNRRDRSDPELLPHLHGFMGFVMARGQRKMTETRYHVLCHLERVRHHLAIEVEDAQLDALAGWAREANAILFLTDATVRAPNGKVLVAPDTGEPEAGAVVPYPADAVRRKEATEKTLAERGIRAPKSLPPVVAEVEVDLRAADAVASRCRALFACAVRAESLGAGKPISPGELDTKIPGAFAALSPKERAFMDAKAPPQQDVVSFSWRYEALDVLRWSVGARDALPFPAGPCDVPALAKAMFADGIVGPRLRPAGEILDLLDLSYRLHWATTEARVNKGPAPAGVDAGVVLERHYALNWLTRFQDAEWDDVDTPT